MSFVRIHRVPRKCRGDMSTWSAQAKYLFKESSRRYYLTEDGKYISNLGSKLTGEIGRVESVRYICSG